MWKILMRVWNVWDPTLWNPDENIFLKLLKPCSSLLKNNCKFFLKIETRLINSSKTWTQRVFKNPDNRPALVITKQKNLQIEKFRKLKKMSPTRSQLDVSKDGKNPNRSPKKALRRALCLLSPVLCRAVECGASGSSLLHWSSGSAALLHPRRSFSCEARVKFEIFAVLCAFFGCFFDNA
jgi:hypothetical protein